jgi:hypothetical protein
VKPKIDISHVCSLANLRLISLSLPLRKDELFLSFPTRSGFSQLSCSIPVGVSQKKMPVGFQGIGKLFQESRLFKLAFLIVISRISVI